MRAADPSGLEAQDGGGATIGDGVGAAVQQGPARVIVELADAPMLPGEAVNRAALRTRLADAQSRMLGSLPAAEFRLTHRFEGLPGFAGEVDAAGLQRLSANGRVKSIVLDGIGYGSMSESIPFINADDVRDGFGATGAGLTVAVLDSGTDNAHPDIAGSIAYEECWLLSGLCPGSVTHQSGPGAAQDDHSHGTHVAGTITSSGTMSQKGVAPSAAIAAYKILASSNTGYISDWITAMSDIVANHPEVDAVNMSLVDNFQHVGGCDSRHPLMTSAINTLRANGVPTFVSSGNNNFTGGITFPACIGSAIAVGAVYDRTSSGTAGYGVCQDVPVADQVVCFSNSSAEVDVLAPGVGVVAPVIGGVGAFTGTSMAAPHAAGVAIQLKHLNPSLTVSQLESAMESTGVPRTDPKNGVVKPRLDAYAAALAVADSDGDLLPLLSDNCPDVANSLQENNDRNFIDVSPPKAYDDATLAMSDLEGDACDTDDDNDGRSDASELAGTSCGAFVTPTNPTTADSDGDRVLDGWECASGTNPADAGSSPSAASCHAASDADGDGVFDARERCFFGTSTANVNSDADTQDDSCEISSINADMTVNVIDLQQVAQHTPTGGQPYLLNMDVNRDGVVNVLDLSYVAARSIPCP